MILVIISLASTKSSGKSRQQSMLIIEPRHEISNNVVCATSKDSDQPAHTRSLIRAIACRLSILWVLSYWLNIVWSFKLTRRLHRVVWVYTCQNATLLEITCHGSFTQREDVYGCSDSSSFAGYIWGLCAYAFASKCVLWRIYLFDIIMCSNFGFMVQKYKWKENQYFATKIEKIDCSMVKFR